MKVGYNLVEQNLIGKKFEEIKEKMSIVEFLRKLYRRQPVSLKISVVGFEKLLTLNENISRYVRNLLSRSLNLLRTRIIQFPINGKLVLDIEPKIKIPEKEIRLTPIFGVKLRMVTPGYFHSPPYI